MNAPPATGSGLERALLGALERTLSAVDWLATDRPVRSDHRVPEAADATIGVRSAKGRSAELRVHVKAAVRPPAEGRSAGSVRPHVSTSAPSSRKRSQIVRPMPLVPPVTITTWPVKSMLNMDVTVGDRGNWIGPI